MTPQFLRALQSAILANADCAQYAVTNDMPKVPGPEAVARDRAIAEIMSAGRTRLAPTRIGELGVLAKYPGGPVAADLVLGKLEAYASAAAQYSRLVARALRGLASADGLDFGDASTQAMLHVIDADGVIDATEAAALRGLALVPDPISPDQVSRALRGPWGDEA